MKRILIFYSHFSPAFKAGGPVQSLVNLVENLKNEYLFYVVCDAYEIGESEILRGIIPDRWNKYNTNTKVFYSRKTNYRTLKAIFQENNPDVVYINGMFLPFYNWLPFYIAKKQNRRIVLAPRGMLQEGALAVKPLKKNLFLNLFKISGLYRNTTWHATDEQERTDIKRIFGDNVDVKIGLNIPKAPFYPLIQRIKRTNELRIVYLSLITEKKNLHIVLEALKEVKIPVLFDIYGPIKDAYYWEKCKELIKNQIHTIQYKGIITPFAVQPTLQGYHAFTLPTKGENFGHAIYEALSVGTVPIISSYTPWKNLQHNEAGLIVSSWSVEGWTQAINALLNKDQVQFDKMSKNAFSMAEEYFQKNDFKLGYHYLFD